MQNIKQITTLTRSQITTLTYKIKDFLLNTIKKISEFKIVVRITELILSLIFIFLYGKKPLIDW